MKKTFTLLTGIVFLTTILIAGGCTAANENGRPNSNQPVKIYLKAVEIDEEMHLEMHDSNNRNNKVVDKLETLVKPGSTVIWKRTWFSGIKKIEKIGSKSGNGPIFKGNAQQIPDKKQFKLDIPKDVPADTVEEYYIEFSDRDGNPPHKIDPQLKIPPS